VDAHAQHGEELTMGWRKTYRYRSSAGKKTVEPGYRYASERRAYMDLTPSQRLKVKEKLEAMWSGKECCNPVHKNRVACPSVLTLGEYMNQLDRAVKGFYQDED
jgi:hypothetical protein